MGSIPGWGNKIARASEQLNSRITTTELKTSSGVGEAEQDPT